MMIMEDRKSVLVVDDEPGIGRILGIKLGLWGFCLLVEKIGLVISTYRHVKEHNAS